MNQQLTIYKNQSINKYKYNDLNQFLLILKVGRQMKKYQWLKLHQMIIDKFKCNGSRLCTR